MNIIRLINHDQSKMLSLWKIKKKKNAILYII